jgi:hypothetical protein
MAKKEVVQSREFRSSKGKCFVRPGIKPPWYEFEFRQPDGTIQKVIGRSVEEFLSEGWDNQLVEEF